MKWLDNMNEKIKKSIRNWLSVENISSYAVKIYEVMDFELNAIRNRIWHRGDANEIEQYYQQSAEIADKYKFWKSRSSQGMEMRKLHTGLPKLLVSIITAIVLADMNDFEFKNAAHEEIWKQTAKKNKFDKRLQKVLRDVLVIGDGAWKVRIDTAKSDYPILSWHPGDRIELQYQDDELREIIFKTPYTHNKREYVLCEHYGYGYIQYHLYHDEKKVALSSLPMLANLTDWAFDESVMLAEYFHVYDSAKWEGRGGSIFDGKTDSFDALDEAWSQWMDALRSARPHNYVPESYIPRNPDTGKLLKPNPFDNRFITTTDNMAEDGKNTITSVQPAIPHDSYLSTYITALDLALQGIVSPSTLGIDVKKLDNAEAQREKEKTTLYTRNAIIEALQEVLPELVQTCINAVNLLHKSALEEIEVDIPFGEYANPSFESQVETVGKGRMNGIMSIEAAVEELYGDSRAEEWKAEEVKRLKEEQGLTELEEPAVNLDGVQIVDKPEETEEEPKDEA